MKTPEIFKYIDVNGNVIPGVVIEEPLVLAREVVVSFLRHIYKNISDPDYLYHPDINVTKIRIEDANNLDLAKLNIWPAITVARSTVSASNLVIGDRANALDNNLKFLSIDIPHGLDMVTGALIVNSYSENSYEAEKLAFINFITFKLFQVNLRKTIFHDFSPIGISPAMLTGSQSDIYMCTVNVNFAITLEWITNVIIDSLFNGCLRLDLDFTVKGGLNTECPPFAGAT
jgi:hypothetical protein